MSKILPHKIEGGFLTKTCAYVHPASKKSVERVLNAPTKGEDGRSKWAWVRLADGTLILGVFPRGNTYFDVEKDAQYPYSNKF